MTARLLYAHKLDPRLRDTETIREQYSPKGQFYEHVSANPGPIYERGGLEDYVARERVDPAGLGGTGLVNYADRFAEKMPDMDLVAFALEMPEGTDAIISNNYALYDILERR